MISPIFVRVGRFIFGKLLPSGMVLPVVRGQLRGTRFVLGSFAGDGGGARAYFGLVEPVRTHILSEHIRPGSRVFDIGANAGYYSLLASKLVGDKGEVVAFEPVVRNLHYLWRHIYINKVSNVRIIGAACSSSTTIKAFIYGRNCAMGHLAHTEISEHSDSVGLVPTVTIDEVIEHIAPPDIIKIDVEGSEFDVLQGARYCLSHYSPKLFLSVHSSKLLQICSNFLRDLGYTVKPLEGSFQEAFECLVYKRSR
jgi:FkbM family methyltransferase